MAGTTPGAAPRRVVCVAANPSIDRLYEVAALEPGAIHRPGRVVARPGGKGLNAARAAAAIGGTVTAIGIVGGHAGAWIEEGLAAAGVPARFARTGGETRTCVSILDLGTGALTELYERGEPLDPGAWEALEGIAKEELGRGDVAALTLSGSLPPGAPRDGFARLAAIGGGAGARVVADVYGAALEAVLRERPALVKVNAAEAAEASGLPVTDAAGALAAAARLREAGAREAVVTLGRAGAVVSGSEGEVRLDPPDAIGRYPVGSGDAFLGALAVALAAGAGLVAAAREGMAAAAANAQVPGAGELDLATYGRLR